MAYSSKLLAAALAALATVNGTAAASGLGGACCGDMQERVAELEATAARKGNRAVSLIVSGEVSKALLIWDDGTESDAYVVDEAAPNEGTRLNFSGEVRLAANATTGFIVELGFTDSSSIFVNQADDDGSAGTAFEVRLANWFVEEESLGRLTLGQQSSATDGITTINLSRAKTDAVLWHNRAFGIRDSAGDYTGLTWGDAAWGLEGERGDYVRYDSPVIHGFVASAAWGEDDNADVALRLQKELNSVRIAAGAGYLWVGDQDAVSLYASETKVASGSISILHLPTGVFANLAAGHADLPRASGSANPDEGTMWMAQSGIEKRISSYGATTLYGEYGRYDDLLLGYAGFTGNAATPSIAADAITGTEVSRWGVGAVQQIDAAALEMYAVFNHFDAEIRSTDGDTQAEPWYGVVVGSRLKF